MAPEVFVGQKYNEKCDIYSWSIVLWQLLAKQLHPYQTHSRGMFISLSTRDYSALNEVSKLKMIYKSNSHLLSCFLVHVE